MTAITPASESQSPFRSSEAGAAAKKPLPWPRVRSKQAARMATDPTLDTSGGQTSDRSIGTITLSLRTYPWEDATVVRCTGRLTIETALLLKSGVKPLLLKERRVILDLTDLAHMDSSGLGALIGLYVSAKGAGCTLELVNLSPRVRELLSLTNVLSVFETSGRHGTRLP